MPTAFVTGATGFVGSNLVRELLARRWNVRALVRSDARSLDDLDVERVRGDLFSPILTAAMSGCDAVFHLAATYSLWHRDRAAVRRANVEGTRLVLGAARRAGVPRVVHTSSVAAIGVRADNVPANETYQSERASLIGAYKRSKFDGEAEAHRAFANGQDVVIVNPTTPVGPWDSRPTPTGEILLRFLAGRMPAYVDTGLNLVDVRDVARGHLDAYLHGRAGDRYILGAENLSLHDLLKHLSALGGRVAPTVRLPRIIPLTYAAFGEFVLAPLGLPADVPLEAVRMSKQRMYYDNAKAKRELGFTTSPLTHALADAIAWFRTYGYLTTSTGTLHGNRT